MNGDFERLRMLRLKHRISRRAMAQALSCNESWLNQLELHGYTGPAARTWAEKYQNALEVLIAEKKAAARP
jgi:transcriptional regulator with XRE-family HTH domain